MYRRSLRTSRTTWREACAATCENRRAREGTTARSAPPSGAKRALYPTRGRIVRSAVNTQHLRKSEGNGAQRHRFESERAAAQSSNARPRIVRALSRRHSRLPPEKAHVTLGASMETPPCSRAKATASRMAVKPVRLQQRGPPRSASFPRTRREPLALSPRVAGHRASSPTRSTRTGPRSPAPHTPLKTRIVPARHLHRSTAHLRQAAFKVDLSARVAIRRHERHADKGVVLRPLGSPPCPP